MVTITVFDGAGCIGGNKIHLGLMDGQGRESGLFFDFGLNYSKLGQYYEEFLRPRSNRGIHDLLAMGIVPPLTCYRQDLCPCDINTSAARRVAVDAVLLSHAHMDHIGHASLLDLDIPFVCTPTTAAIMKSLRDCNRGDFQYDGPYTSLRRQNEDEPRCISSTKQYIGRDFVLTADCNHEFHNFWSTTPSVKYAKRAPQNYEPGTIDPISSLDLDIKCYPVDHSIYGAVAYAVDTEAGWIVYSGDLRTHGRNGHGTLAFAEKARDLCPRLLIVEGTRASREDREESEDLVEENCLRATNEENGLVIGDFGPRNVERLETFHRIARATNRELVVLPKDAYLLEGLRCADGVNRLSGLRIYDEMKSREDKYEEEIRDRFANRLVGAEEIADDPGSFILSFSFWDMGRMLDIRPGGGTYIYSSSEAYSEEQQIDFRRLSNWLARLGMKAVGFRMTVRNGREVPEHVPGYHASGHIAPYDLLDLVRTIRPHTVMPVHTEAPEFFVEGLKGEGINVLIPQEGRTYHL